MYTARLRVAIRVLIPKQPAVAIAPIRSALFQLDPYTGTFTTAHLHFIRLCVETRSYSEALPILDNYIHSIPTNLPAILNTLEYSVPAADHVNSGDYIHTRSNHSEKVSLQAVQEYYILGAMAYIGQHQYEKAKNFLEHVLVVPSTNGVANGLMLEAYKKWVLVSCLANGFVSGTPCFLAVVVLINQVKSPPRTINGIALRTVKSASKAYDALGAAFVQLTDMTKLRAQSQAGRDMWADVSF